MINDRDTTHYTADIAASMIKAFNKNKDDPDCIKTEYDMKYIAVYYGNILSIVPSGKYYMPWTTNQTAEEEEADSAFWEEINILLDKQGLWIESGEGDALDLYICGGGDPKVRTHHVTTSQEDT